MVICKIYSVQGGQQWKAHQWDKHPGCGSETKGGGEEISVISDMEEYAFMHKTVWTKKTQKLKFQKLTFKMELTGEIP